MKAKLSTQSTIDLLLLAAIWGASFLFMRVGSPEFGPFLFAALRTSIAAIFLFFCLLYYKQTKAMQGCWWQITFAGTFNTAIPFALFSYATLTLSAGTASVLNACTPMFTAIVGFFWLKERLNMQTVLGLMIGFIGVYFLVSENTTFTDTHNSTQSTKLATLLPSLTALMASCCYGIAANFTKKHLNNITPLALATGSQISASVILLPISLFFIPETPPSTQAIGSVLLVGIICTGVAYILFFRLIAQIGPTKTISVTYLIPAFGLLWGALFLDEKISLIMLIGSSVILSGVALTTNIFNK